MVTATAVTTETAAVERVIAFARAQLGKRYVFGAAGPNTWDCSGLIMVAWQHGGVKLPHFTGTMVGYGVQVAKKDLIPGDLIFPNPHHVQLYVGNGKVIEAPETGIPVREVPMWGFMTARRVSGLSNGSVVATGSGGSPSKSDAGFIASANASGGSSSIAGLGNLISWMTTAHNWYRVGIALAGIAAIVTALLSITKTGGVP